MNPQYKKEHQGEAWRVVDIGMVSSTSIYTYLTEMNGTFNPSQALCTHWQMPLYSLCPGHIFKLLFVTMRTGIST